MATVLQVPLGAFPRDVRSGAHQWAIVRAVAAHRGLEPVRHGRLPVERALWIGFTEPVLAGIRHTVVMAHGELLHDPAGGVELLGSPATRVADRSGSTALSTRSC